VAATGGDGTVNEVLNGLPADNPPAIAMLPSGTANVFAKELGIPRDAAGLAGMLRDGREIPWDLGVERLGGRKFLLFASAGYDAHVVHVFHAARTGPIQMWQYIYWGLKSIVEYAVPRIEVEIDGTRVTSSAAWVTISNVPSYGGPLVFTPHARPDNRTFEVMIQHARHKRDIVRLFFAAILNWLTGVEYRMGDVTFHQARRVRLTSADGRPVPVQVDGDPGGHLARRPLRVRPTSMYCSYNLHHGVQIVPSGQRLCVHSIGGMLIGYLAAFASSISMPKPGLSLGHKYPLYNSGMPGNTSLSGSPKKIIS
jgi:diacylglycerol kinase family enzyme